MAGKGEGSNSSSRLRKPQPLLLSPAPLFTYPTLRTRLRYPNTQHVTHQ